MKHLRLIVIVLGATLAFAGCESRQSPSAVSDKIMLLEKRIAEAEKTIEKLKEEQVTGVPSLRAREFVLVDENGKGRATLAVGKNGPGLSLHDEDGKTRASMIVNKNGPSLDFMDENGNIRAMLAVDKDGPGLTLIDEKNNLRAMLAVDKDRSGLCLSDENGKARAWLEEAKIGSSLALFGEKKTRVGLSTFKNGPNLDFMDENGKIRAVLAVDKNGPAMTLSDENGKTRALLGAETRTLNGKTIRYPESP